MKNKTFLLVLIWVIGMGAPTFQQPDCAGSKQPSHSRVFYQIFGLGKKDFRILIKVLEKDRISEFTREDFIEWKKNQKFQS